MFTKFKGSFVLTGRSIRDQEVLSTVESIRLQDLLDWECLLLLEERPTEHELLALSHHNPRFKIASGEEWNLWDSLKSDLAIHVTAGTCLMSRALRLICSSIHSETLLAYGDSTGVTRPNWSPIRYLTDHYFGDVVAIPRPSAGRRECTRIPEQLSLGGRKSFHRIPAAFQLAEISTARTNKYQNINVVIPTAGFSKPGNNDDRPMITDLLDSLGVHEDVTTTVVLDSFVSTRLRDDILSRPQTSVVSFDEPFNFARKCNLGASAFESDIVFFLNDDMTCLTPDWPSTLRAALSYEAVAAVGGLLVNRDGLVQCAGHANHPVPHLFGVGLDPSDSANFYSVGMPREASGLSGACFAVKHNAFEAVGGMCELLPSSYNDVDLGFKLMESGWSLLYEPALKFVHLESASRDAKVGKHELQLIGSRWGRYFDQDPYTP